jgi:hypothetical protein
MPRKTAQPGFQERLASLRSAEFDVQEVAGVPGRIKVSKNGSAAILSAGDNGAVAYAARPGIVLDGEISRILDRGNQKFLKTTKLEVPATADHLRALHLFSEELKLATGGINLYNESLGTVSDRYYYDRLKGRDLPESKRTRRPWELPAETKK